MIAIVICFVGLFSSNDFFFKIIYGNIFIFLGAFILGSYDFLRIKYWTYYASTVIVLSKNQAIKLFNDYNSKVECLYLKEVPVPCTCILQIAIKCKLWQIANDKNEYWLSRQMLKIVLKTGG
jgi:hypothetical protein